MHYITTKGLLPTFVSVGFAVISLVYSDVGKVTAAADSVWWEMFNVLALPGVIAAITIHTVHEDILNIQGGAWRGNDRYIYCVGGGVCG